MGFLSGLLDRMKGNEAVDYTHLYIDDARSPSHARADEHYVRVWLRSARITDVRRWTKKFHAMVHAQFVYTDRFAGRCEVMAVVAPDKTFQTMDPHNIDRFIVINQPLLGPIPYRGELGMDVGLFSVSASDLAKPYLDLLAGLTETASVGFLAQAKAFVDPLRRGAETLLGDGNQAELEIGLSRTDTDLRVGNILVARTEKGTVDATDLRVDPQDFRLLNAAGRPVTDFPYMIIGVEATTERGDYAAIPDIRAGWEAVRRVAFEGGPTEQLRKQYSGLSRVIWLSPDLIQTDKRRIIDIFSRELAGAGYDMQAPTEFAALEAIPKRRPLREASELFATLSRQVPVALEGVSEASVASERISMAELQARMTDLSIAESELRQYFIANPETSKPFSPSIIPDPARVEVAAPTDAMEGAMVMDWANALCRLRRKRKFLHRRKQGDRRLVLVSEGDSWFQFPLFLEDVVDQVLPDFNVWSVGAAGDTLQNMVLDNAEYLQALHKLRSDVRAFLFSGGGNDIVGEDENGRQTPRSRGIS